MTEHIGQGQGTIHGEIWEHREVAVRGLLVAALSLIIGLIFHSWAWGIASLLVLAAITRQLSAGARQAKAKPVSARKAAERDRLLPVVAAWDEFLRSTEECGFQKLRARRSESITDSEWRVWKDALGKGRRLAENVEVRLRPMARSYLAKLEGFDRKNLTASIEVYDSFKNWLMMQNMAYASLRSHAGVA